MAAALTVNPVRKGRLTLGNAPFFGAFPEVRGIISRQCGRVRWIPADKVTLNRVENVSGYITTSNASAHSRKCAVGSAYFRRCVVLARDSSERVRRSRTK